METENNTKQKLIAAAVKARAASYSPYSQFPVGAALIASEDGSIHEGCNVENASYGLAICAERTAIVKAVSMGYRKFDAIAVTANTTSACAPCGACRQFMCEFGLDITVYMCNSDGTVCEETTTGALIPHSFGPHSLNEAKQ